MKRKIGALALLAVACSALLLWAQTGPAPAVVYTETDQFLPAGRWRTILNGNVFQIQRNTHASGNFLTQVAPFSLSTTGVTIQEYLTVGTGITSPNYTLTGAPLTGFYGTASQLGLIANGYTIFFDGSTSPKSLFPEVAGATNLGKTDKPFADIFIAGSSGTPDTNRFRFTGVSTGGLRTITFPDASITVGASGDAAPAGTLTGTTLAPNVVTSSLTSTTAANFSIGTTPATTGALRLPNAAAIYFRRADNAADRVLIASDGANETSVGNNSGTTFLDGTIVSVRSTSPFNWSTDTGLKRAAAGIVQVTDGSSGSGSLLTPTIYGDSAANGDLTLDSTSHVTKTSAYLIMQPNGGNVGIGTTTPGAKLEVVSTTSPLMIWDFPADGYAAINEAGAVRGYLGIDIGVFSNAIAGAVGLRSQGVLHLGTGGEADLTIDADGNVGIGTIAPAKAFEINSATGVNLRLTYNDADGSAANYADFSMSSDGNLTIAPSGGVSTISGNIFASTTPTIASGFGTGPSIAGKATAFRVTVGTGGDTAGIVNFATTFSNAPICSANNETTGNLARTVTSTTQVTINAVMVQGDLVTVQCQGY